MPPWRHSIPKPREGFVIAARCTCARGLTWCTEPGGCGMAYVYRREVGMTIAGKIVKKIKNVAKGFPYMRK